MLTTLFAMMLSLRDGQLDSVSDAAAHARAAAAAASPEVPLELLLAVAYRETRWDELQVSRAKGGLYCGVVQAMARIPGQRGYSEQRCRDLADLTLGYRAGADELRAWLARTRGDMTQALAHHACGNVATPRRCQAYARGIMVNYRRFQRANLPVS